MTNEEAVKHLKNDWYISLSGQVCIDKDVADSFLKAVGIGIKAIDGQKNHPAHIDTEAWEPCGNCKPCCANCVDCDVEDIDDEAYPMVCQCCVNHNNFRPRDMYCSACGRPLTKEARALLEKRLRG